MKLDFRQRLLGTTLLVGASMLATPAFAQDAPAADTAAQPAPAPEAAPEAAEPTKDIVVTGTRIPSANLESAAPVTVVNAQDLKLTGTTRVEDLLNTLPSVGAAQASGVSNASNGTATVDLRYLSAKRTLALINGRRMVPGDPNSTAQAADLNFIPSSLVKRAEVLTAAPRRCTAPTQSPASSTSSWIPASPVSGSTDSTASTSTTTAIRRSAHASTPRLTRVVPQLARRSI
jgi:outer membrane receptor protein involved in Fe transport